MTKFGFCYVADCDPYIDEAMHSIASLREHMPDVPIAMVTRPELFRPDTPVTDWVELAEARKGPIVKSNAWLVPYDRVGFIDSDTLVLGDLTDVFDLLDQFDFVYAPEPNSRTDRGTSGKVPAAFVEPNSGFFLFRKSPEAEALFRTWIEEFDLLHAEHGVTANQPALRNALWKCTRLRHLVVGHEYNLIPHTNSSVSKAVMVLHDRSPERFRLAEEINREIEPRAIVAGFGPMFGYLGRRSWMRQFARLAWRFLYVFFRPQSVQQQSHPVIWWRDGID